MAKDRDGRLEQLADRDQPHVVVYLHGQSSCTVFRDVQAVAAKVGFPVFAAFMKCFNAIDRANALHHLLYLNAKASTANVDPVADELAYDRNVLVVAMLLTGTMYEVGEALQTLCSAKVAADPALREAWAPLDTLRAEWFQDEEAKLVRHNFSHHLGERDDYEIGVAMLGRDAVLVEHESDRRFAGRYWAPWEALLDRHGFKGDFAKRMIVRTREAHDRLPQLMFEFFRAVLDAKGVPVIAVNGRPPERGRAS